MESLIRRFLTYVRIDTQSDPSSESCPSTEKQWQLARLLENELKTIGMADVHLDSKGYLMATLPSNLDKEIPVIGFIAHYDTSPDYTGFGVNPKIWKNYTGTDLTLNNNPLVILSPKEFPELKRYIGDDLITTDGTTLLGADDKAGIAEIVSAMDYLIQHPEIKHGTIRVCFTPDEEIGRGAHNFDVKAFGAKWAYTVDGGHLGELEYESFNAAWAQVRIKGTSVHPGSAKGKMINSMLLAQEFLTELPSSEIPQRTEGREGFYHLMAIKGNVEETHMEFIIRDHDFKTFQIRKEKINEIQQKLNSRWGEPRVEVTLKDQYYNMGEKIKPVMQIVHLVEDAMNELGIKPIVQPIRGGTDGSQLSYMGLPCPNIFAGGVNFHGPYEFISIQSMQKAVNLIVKISEKTACL